MRAPLQGLSIVLALIAPGIVVACGVSSRPDPGGSTTTTGGDVTATTGGTGGRPTTTSSGAGGALGEQSGSTTSTSSSTTSTSSSTTSTSATGTPDAAACGTTVSQFPLAASPHVALCSPVTYATNPPTSGPHYAVWAAFQTYTTPVPRGFWVHDMEHGGVVITYNCPNGCDADLAQLAAHLDARPADPTCVPPVRARIVVTPDPLLDVRFAASAWGWALRSSCFDLSALGAFIDAHYAQAPEDECTNGLDVTTNPNVPADCGQADGG